MEILAERILLHNLGHLTAAEKFNNFQFFFLDTINNNQILQLITNKFLNDFFFRKKKTEITTNFLRHQQPAG